jgi:hypothetical protein
MGVSATFQCCSGHGQSGMERAMHVRPEPVNLIDAMDVLAALYQRVRTG